MEFNPWLHFWDGIGEVLEYKKQTWKKQLHSCLWHHQFKNRIGSGDRIWTCDLRVMSPTSYQTAPPRNYCVFDVTVILRFGMPSQNNQSRLKGIGSGDRIWTCDLRVMSPTSYQTAPPRNQCETSRVTRNVTISLLFKSCKFPMAVKTYFEIQNMNQVAKETCK